MSDAQGAARRFVVITDFDYGDTDIERAILEPIGAEVVAQRPGARTTSSLMPPTATPS